MSCNILIVEDCEPIRSFVRAYLEGRIEGCRCREAGSAEEGLALAETERPDAVIMDVDLPGMSGTEATRVLRSRDSDIRVIMFTALDDERCRRDSAAAGACGFVRKSDFAELVPLITGPRPVLPRAAAALLAAALLWTVPGAAIASDLADDDASHSAYDTGWSDGANGGSGWGAWQLSVGGVGGHFTGSSAANAGGSSGSIDTGGRSWGLWSSSGTTEAVRPLNGELMTGQTIRVAFDNGYVDSGGSVGFALRNTPGQNLWEFYFVGGATNYYIHHNGGAFATDIPFTGDGIFVEFTLTGETSYFARVQAGVLGGTASTFYAYSGDLIAQVNTDIEQVRVWNAAAGGGSDRDVFVNQLQVMNSALADDSNDPHVDSFFTSALGKYARLYESDADRLANISKTTWSRGTTTQSVPAYGGVQAIYSSAAWLYVRSSGLGIHTMGPWYLNAAHTTDFPNYPVNQKTLWRLPRKPVVTSTHSQTALGAIGVFVDGVSMFDSRDGYVWTGSGESGSGTGYWNRDAYVNESVTFDPAYAHQEQSGNYHYHANPIALRYLLDDHVTFNTNTRTYSESTQAVTNHSPILGWVRDGHPIYGPYGYSNPTNPASGLRRMISGYTLRNGTNGTDNLAVTGRNTIPAWAQRAYGVGPNQSGPTVNGTYPLGRYMEDNAYLGDLGYTKGVHFDLDEYNGRFCVTPEFPNGVYAYFVSIASNGAPVFPYNIGRTFHATTQGSTTTTISEPVATNFLGGPYGEEALASVGAVGGNVTLVWSSLEGGGYVVESSTNLVQWTGVATNISATSNSLFTTRVLTNGAASDDVRFHRVRRVSLAAYDDILSGGGGGGGGSGILSVSPTSGTRGNSVPFTLNLDGSAPPQAAPVISLRFGTNTIAGASHATQFTVTGTFNIPAGAATGPQDIVLIWPGPPGNPTAYVTNSLPGGFTIN